MSSRFTSGTLCWQALGPALAFATSLLVVACSSDDRLSDDRLPDGRPPDDRLPVLLDLQVATDEDTPIDISVLDGAEGPVRDTLTVISASAGIHRADIIGGAIIRVTPARNFHGLIQVSYEVGHGSHATVAGRASVTVRPVNDAPVAAGGTLQIRRSIVIVLAASDVDGNVLRYEIVDGPDHGTITGGPPDVLYTPAIGFAGDDAITYRAFDGTATSEPATWHLRVDPGATPVAIPGSVSGSEDQPLDVTLHGTDQDGDSLRFTIEAPPRHGTLSSAAPNFRYTPAPDFAGDDSFEFSVSDGILSSARATIAIHVAPANDPPVAIPHTIAAAEDTSAAITLNGHDVDGDPIGFAITTPPAHGTLSGTPPALIYTPTPNYHGPDAFTYTTSDGRASSAPAQVTLQVQAVNDPPVAVDSSVTTTDNDDVTIRLNASDVDGQPLTFTIVTAPDDGNFGLSGARLTYTPAQNATGTRSFTFRVSDGAASDTGNVTIQITSINEPPVAGDDFVATDPGVLLVVSVLANDADPDGDPLELASVDEPAHGTIAIAGGALVYTPDAGFTGVEVLPYAVVDAFGVAATGQVHIGVGTFPPGAPFERIAAIDASVSLTALELNPAISSNGRYIAFTTTVSLVGTDTHSLADIYLHDRGTRTLTRISVASNGAQGNGPSQRPQLSADGRYTVFESSASNLVAGDTNGVMDVFRHDRVTRLTERVSVATGGRQGGAPSSHAVISDDGTLVAFLSSASDLVAHDGNGASDIFLRDLAAGTTTRISVTAANGDGDLGSTEPAISGDGRFVAFTSAATNLVVGDTNQLHDIFLHDRIAGTTTRASVGPGGEQANGRCTGASLSRDGRFVSFTSTATNLVPGAGSSPFARIYLRDVQSPAATVLLLGASGLLSRISGDGRYLTLHDVSSIVHDRVTANTWYLSPFTLVNTFPALSGDSQYLVVFHRIMSDSQWNIAVFPNSF